MLGNSGALAGVVWAAHVLMHLCRAYNVISGLFQAPYYAFSQTMMAELSPPGFENMVSIFHMSPAPLR